MHEVDAGEVIMVLSANLFSDAVQDAFNPHSRARVNDSDEYLKDQNAAEETVSSDQNSLRT